MPSVKQEKDRRTSTITILPDTKPYPGHFRTRPTWDVFIGYPGKSSQRYFFGEVGKTWRNTVFSANETLGITIGNTELTLELGPIFSNRCVVEPLVRFDTSMPSNRIKEWFG